MCLLILAHHWYRPRVHGARDSLRRMSTYVSSSGRSCHRRWHRTSRHISDTTMASPQGGIPRDGPTPASAASPRAKCPSDSPASVPGRASGADPSESSSSSFSPSSLPYSSCRCRWDAVAASCQPLLWKRYQQWTIHRPPPWRRDLPNRRRPPWSPRVHEQRMSR